MDISEIKKVFFSGNLKEKKEMLSCFCDILESYNKNIPMLNEIIQFLVDISIVSYDFDILIEILDTICFAQIYQNVDDVNFDAFEEYINNSSELIIPRIINILGYTHNEKYVKSIQKFQFHSNIQIRNAAQDAMLELGIL